MQSKLTWWPALHLCCKSATNGRCTPFPAAVRCSCSLTARLMSSSDCLGDDTLTEVDSSLVREQERAMLMGSCGVYSTEAWLAALDMSRFSDWAEPAGNSCSSREVDCSCGGKRWLLCWSALGCGSAKRAGGSMLLDCWVGDLLERPGPDMGRIAGMVKAAML